MKLEDLKHIKVTEPKFPGQFLPYFGKSLQNGQIEVFQKVLSLVFTENVI